MFPKEIQKQNEIGTSLSQCHPSISSIQTIRPIQTNHPSKPCGIRHVRLTFASFATQALVHAMGQCTTTEDKLDPSEVTQDSSSAQSSCNVTGAEEETRGRVHRHRATRSLQPTAGPEAAARRADHEMQTTQSQFGANPPSAREARRVGTALRLEATIDDYLSIVSQRYRHDTIQ